MNGKPTTFLRTETSEHETEVPDACKQAYIHSLTLDGLVNQQVQVQHSHRILILPTTSLQLSQSLFQGPNQGGMAAQDRSTDTADSASTRQIQSQHGTMASGAQMHFSPGRSPSTRHCSPEFGRTHTSTPDILVKRHTTRKWPYLKTRILLFEESREPAENNTK